MEQAAYIFDPNENALDGSNRPAKRRKVSKKNARSAVCDISTLSSANDADPSRYFLPLISGSEEPFVIQVRQRLFEGPWGQIEGRIQVCASGVSSWAQ